MPKESLQEWHARLLALAKSKDLEWVISPSPKDHHDGYSDGYSIEEEFDAQLDACG